MNILAIDTTTKTASVSLKFNDVIFCDEITNEITHSEKLLPLIDSVLCKANAKLMNVNMLACINGPGSFTGIRIGLATLKAISQVNNLNIFSINSLELTAYASILNNYISDCEYITSIIDTNNDRVFYITYKIEKKNDNFLLVPLTDISNEYIDDAILSIQNNMKKCNAVNGAIVGNCISKFDDKIKYLNLKSYDFYPSTTDCINAFKNILNADDYIFNAYSLKANYARASQAERMKNPNV